MTDKIETTIRITRIGDRTIGLPPRLDTEAVRAIIVKVNNFGTLTPGEATMLMELLVAPDLFALL